MSRPVATSAPLPAALIGNGSLLATLSASGELLRLWWPHPDRGQHLGSLRLGLDLDGAVRWLDDVPLEWTQEWLGQSTILRSFGQSPELSVEIVDLVLPDEPVLRRRVSVLCGSEPLGGAKVVVSCRPELDGHTRALGAHVDGATGSLVFYRSPVALALGTCPGGDAAHAGLGRVEGTLRADLHGSVEVVFALAGSPDEAA